MSLLVGSTSARTYPFGYFGLRAGSGDPSGTPDALATNSSAQATLLSAALSQYALAAISGTGQAVSGLAINANRLATAAQPILDTGGCGKRVPAVFRGP